MQEYLPNIHQEHFKNQTKKEKIDRYIKITCAYLNLFEFETVLDVGASDGKIGEFIKGQYTGIDINPMSDRVDKKSIFDISNNFDLIIFNHVLEHMPNSQDVIKQVGMISKKYVFINVPIGEWAYKLEGHINLFNLPILERNMKGFCLLESGYHCFRENKVELWTMWKKCNKEE